MYEEEYSAVVSVLLDKAFDGVEMLCSMWVCPVGECVLDAPEVCEFGLCFGGCASWM